MRWADPGSELELGDQSRGLHLRPLRAARRGAGARTSGRRVVGVPRNTLEGVLDISVTTQRRGSKRSAVLDLHELGHDCLAWIGLRNGTIDVRVAARSVDQLAAAREWIRERYPLTETTEEQRVDITFWSLGCYGASSSNRRIDVPTWSEVADNYPAAVADRVARIRQRGLPAGGRRPSASLARAAGDTGKRTRSRPSAGNGVAGAICTTSPIRRHSSAQPLVIFRSCSTRTTRTTIAGGSSSWRTRASCCPRTRRNGVDRGSRGCSTSWTG